MWNLLFADVLNTICLIFKILGAIKLAAAVYSVTSLLFLVSFCHSFSCVNLLHQADKILTLICLILLRWPETIACYFFQASVRLLIAIPYEHLSNLHLKYVFELFVACYLDNDEQKVGNNNPFNGIQQKGV